MKLKHTLHALSAAILLAGASMPASAAYVVLDGWQLVTPTSTTTDIGRLNLASGTSTIFQEVDSTNNVFVGAQFSETGAIFSVSYTRENVVGAGDSSPGLPPILLDGLTLSFTNVMGTVTALNSGGGFRYNFTSGDFVLSGTGGPYASGSIVGLGGNASTTAVIGGINGDSTVLSTIDDILNAAFDLRDSGGNSLQPQLEAGTVLFQAVTNNNTTSVNGSGLVCPFITQNRCVSLSVASGGDAYLVQDVPEPGSLALAGLALFGIGAASRRTRKWKQ